MHTYRRPLLCPVLGLIALILLLAGSPRALRAQGGSPVLVNPSFEDGVVNWATQPTCAYTTYASTPSDPSQNGGFFMAANRGSSTACRAVYQDISFASAANTPYRLAAYVRSAVATSRTGFLALSALGSNPVRMASATFTATRGPWQCVEVQLMTVEAQTLMRVELGMTTLTAGDFHFDNVLIQQTSTPLCPQVGQGSARQPLYVSAYARNGGAALGTATEIVNATSPAGAMEQQLSGGAKLWHDEIRDTPFQSVPVYVLPEPFLSDYESLGGATSWLGPSPTSDRFTNAANQPQVNFANGKIIYNGANPIISSWPISTAGQWYAEFHNGSNFNAGPTWVQNEIVGAAPYQLVHLWGEATPGDGKWGVWNNNFVVRWTGRFNFAAGDYLFSGSGDDQLKVWVDNELILVSKLTDETNIRSMTAGQHTIRVEMVEIGGGANMLFGWEAAPPCTLTINNGAMYTKAPQVFVRSTVPNGFEQQLANSSDFSGAAWQTYQVSSTWTLSNPAGQVARVPVYGRYRAAGGGQLCDAFETDSIVHDQVAPTLTASSNTPFFASVLTLNAADQADGSGVAEMQISTSPTFAGAVWRPYDTRVAVAPAIGRIYYVRVRDTVGNVSGTVLTGAVTRRFLPMIRR